MAFAAVWTGKAESDGFNKLILALPCSWREAASSARSRAIASKPASIRRKRCKSRRSQITRKIAALILAFFKARFDPNLPESHDTRVARSSKLEFMIESKLTEVVSLDEDRALRRIAHLVKAILRTNYYQIGRDGEPKSYMSFKIDSHAVAELPAPKPYREIWVASPQVEGVHLRFGAVARGGLALVRSARRLPHRSARSRQSAAGEERHHRAGWREGRLLSEALARARRAWFPRSRR